MKLGVANFNEIVWLQRLLAIRKLYAVQIRTVGFPAVCNEVAALRVASDPCMVDTADLVISLDYESILIFAAAYRALTIQSIALKLFADGFRPLVKDKHWLSGNRRSTTRRNPAGPLAVNHFGAPEAGLAV